MISDEELDLMDKKFEEIEKKYPDGFLTEEEREIKEVTDSFLKSRTNEIRDNLKEDSQETNKKAKEIGMKTIYIDPVDEGDN